MLVVNKHSGDVWVKGVKFAPGLNEKTEAELERLEDKSQALEKLVKNGVLMFDVEVPAPEPKRGRGRPKAEPEKKSEPEAPSAA